MTDKPIITLEGKSIGEYFEQIVENKKLKDKLKAKEQECKELRSVRDGWMSKCEQETKLREFTNEQLDQLEAENKKLKQTLTEIKEIAKKHKATAHCNYLTDMDEILQKISEVEDDRQS